ncbi:MAG: shikimate dehydrogenase [Nitrosomonas sp.]|nr:shikimate dehydrogenase [Nitrosomonas sp.]
MDRYAVVGNPIQHSKSPFIHAQFTLQTEQIMRYEAILAPLDQFKQTVDIFHQSGGKGMNITVPFKLEAYTLATRLTERAASAQAVNTFRFEQDGAILGDNTDGAGLVRDIEINLNLLLQNKRLLLLGAGGAAHGVMLPLLQTNPALLAIANRTPDKARQLAQQFIGHGRIEAGHFLDFSGERFDIIINATSASLQNQLPPLPPAIFTDTLLAYDMLYAQQLTPFLRFARNEGARQIADGTGMLVEQAAESFFLWRGIRPETQTVIRQVRQAQSHAL